MCMVHRPDVQDAGTCLCGTATVYVCAGGGGGGHARFYLFISVYTWLVLLCVFFLNALYEWKVIKTNSCTDFNFAGR